MFRILSAALIAALAATSSAKTEVVIHRSDSSTIIQPAVGVDSITFNTGLICYYPFNKNPLDESGSSNHGIVYGPKLTTDRFGDTSAYLFDGFYGNLSIVGNLGVDFTISAWVLTAGSPKVQYIIGASDTATNKGYLLYLTTTNKLRVDFGDGGSGTWPYGSLTSATSVSANVWHHVAAVRNGASLKLYVDGKLDTTGSCGTRAVSNLYNYSIGGIFESCFNGKIDQVRVYTSALPDAMVKSLARERGMGRK